MGFSRQEYWSVLPFPSQGDLPDPEIKCVSPALAGEFFTTEPPGKPRRGHLCYCSSVLQSGCHLLSRRPLWRPVEQWHPAKPIQAKHKPSRLFFFYLKKFSKHVLPIGDNVTRLSLFPFSHVELGRGTEQEDCRDNCVSQAPEKKVTRILD